jgi:hypothetical protein
MKYLREASNLRTALYGKGYWRKESAPVKFLSSL